MYVNNESNPARITHSPGRLARLRPLAILVCCALVAPMVQAENLQQIFQLAAAKDPEIRQQRARYNATHTNIDLGRSALLPQISATGSFTRNASGPVDDPSGTGREFDISKGYYSKAYGLTLSQALVNFQAWYQFKSYKISDESATLQLAAQEQQLIIKVAKAYFDVLRSQANLTSFDAQENANKQLLEQAQQRFDVGLNTITDVYAAQATADSVSVSKLREQNNLNQRFEALQAIIGQPVDNISQLNSNFPIVPLEPAMQTWVDLAKEQNLAIRIAALDRDAREQDVKAAKARAYPTVSLSTTLNWSKDGTANYTVIPPQAFETAGVSLRFSIPLVTSGQLSAGTHQANYNFDASKEGLTKSERDNIQATRNAYRSAETDVKAVAASSKSVVSAQSSYESTQVGAEVGTRNIVEVLQAQQLLFQAQRDYSNARFDYVIDTLTLKQAAGVLSPQDVTELNQWLSQ